MATLAELRATGLARPEDRLAFQREATRVLNFKLLDPRAATYFRAPLGKTTYIRTAKPTAEDFSIIRWGQDVGLLARPKKTSFWKQVAPIFAVMAPAIFGLAGGAAAAGGAGGTGAASGFAGAAEAAAAGASGFAGGGAATSALSGAGTAAAASGAALGTGVLGTAVGGKTATASLGLSSTEKILLASSLAPFATPTPNFPSPAPLGEAPEITNRTQDFETRKQQMDRMASAAGVTRSMSDADMLGPRRGAKARGSARRELVGY